MLNELTNVRQDLATLLEQEKELKHTKTMLETQIATSLKEQGIDRVGNDQCTVSLKQEIVPTVDDWDMLHQHIIDTKQFELLQKRMSATAYRELLQMGQAVPGVTSTELTRINFRSK
jgi:hypothetical protein